MHAHTVVLVLAAVLLPPVARAQQPAEPVPIQPVADSALIFPPTRGSLIVQLVDSASGAPLAGGYIELARGSARFQPAHWPSKGAPTDVSVFANVPVGVYSVLARRVGYNVRRVPVSVAPGGTDTVRIALDYYRGCDLCGEPAAVPPRKRSARPKPPVPSTRP